MIAEVLIEKGSVPRDLTDRATIVQATTAKVAIARGMTYGVLTLMANRRKGLNPPPPTKLFLLNHQDGPIVMMNMDSMRTALTQRAMTWKAGIARATIVDAGVLRRNPMYTEVHAQYAMVRSMLRVTTNAGSTNSATPDSGIAAFHLRLQDR